MSSGSEGAGAPGLNAALGFCHVCAPATVALNNTTKGSKRATLFITNSISDYYLFIMKRHRFGRKFDSLRALFCL